MNDSDRVFELFLQGWEPFDMADELGIDFNRVSALLLDVMSQKAATPEAMALGDRARDLFDAGLVSGGIAAELGIPPGWAAQLLVDAQKRRTTPRPPLSPAQHNELGLLMGRRPAEPPPAPPEGSLPMEPLISPDDWVIVERDPDPDVLEEEGESYLYVEFSDMVSNQHELIEGVAQYLAALPSVEKAWREDTELILVQAPLTEDEVLAVVKQWWSDHDGPTSWDEAG